MDKHHFISRIALTLIPLMCLILTMAFAFSCTASAQILTARAELTNNENTTYIGKNIYVTKDEDETLTEDIIISSHQNNLRGDRSESNIVHLGFTDDIYWLVFSLTNNSDTENWVLDFGNLWNGRIGFVESIKILAHNEQKTFIDTPQQPNSKEEFNGSAIPLKLEKGKTELFVVKYKPTGYIPTTISPRLIKEKAYRSETHIGKNLSRATHVLFIAIISFFLALVTLNKRPEFLMTAGFYALEYLFFFILNYIFLAPYDLTAELTIILLSASTVSALFIGQIFLRMRLEEYFEKSVIFSLALMVIVGNAFALFALGPGSEVSSFITFGTCFIALLALSLLSFLQSQKGKFSGDIFALAWLIHAFGFGLTALGLSGLIEPNILIYSYWISLIPHGFLTFVASARKIKLIDQEMQHRQAKENRAQQSKARLQQSKESADQARLLRVIERERELMADLREREMQRTEEMRRAKEAADSANNAKSAFLAVVSHEIRTPMTGIMGIVRLLNETKLTEEQTDYTLAIQKSGDTMMTLLNDILDFEKIETGAMKLEDIDFDLPKLVQGVVTLMTGHAADKGVSLKSDISKDFPRYLIGDPTRLRQVLLNLVNNAIKFTQEGNVTIRLRASLTEKQPQSNKNRYEIYFAVEDTGIGISEDAQKNLFNPFEQADASVSRKFGGTGLGLAICQRLIDAMGSTIQVESFEGQGSTFFFTLEMHEGNEALAEEAESITNSTTGTTSSTLQGLRILVVEDNEINRKVLQNFLEKDGHSVTVSASGEDALEKVTQNIFDIIFTDIQLTGITGLEFTKKIRAMNDHKIAQTPIIAITGNVSEDDYKLAKEAGIDETLAKPIDYDSLRQMILAFSPEPTPNIPASPIGTTKPEQDPLTSTIHDNYRQTALDMTETDTPPGANKNDEKAPIHQYLSQKEKQFKYDEEFKPQEEEKPTEEIAKKPLKKVNTANDKAKDKKTAQAKTKNNIFDSKMLESLKTTLDRETLLDLIKGFTDKADEIVDALSPDLDIDDIHAKAHELKGMAANFGMTELSDIAQKIEDDSKNGEEERAKELIKELPDANARASAAITQWAEQVE